MTLLSIFWPLKINVLIVNHLIHLSRVPWCTFYFQRFRNAFRKASGNISPEVFSAAQFIRVFNICQKKTIDVGRNEGRNEARCADGGWPRRGFKT